jgi:methanogenic corrinoid protein MtbC1
MYIRLHVRSIISERLPIVAQQSLHQLAIWHIATKSHSSNMVVVAVAGGTGNVGRAIVETLLESAKHKVIVLGRKVI